MREGIALTAKYSQEPAAGASKQRRGSLVNGAGGVSSVRATV